MTIDVNVLENLMPNILTVLTQLCATALLFVLMKKLAWQPVMKILSERSKYEQERLQEADRLKKEQESMMAQAEKELEEAGQKAQQTIQSAREEGEKLKEKLITEGRERQKQLVEDAERDISLQKSKMLDEVHKEMVNVAINATSKMLGEKVDAKTDKKVVESFIKEVSKK